MNLPLSGDFTQGISRICSGRKRLRIGRVLQQEPAESDSGEETFRDRLIDKAYVDREHPRHERVAVRPSVDKVLKALAKTYRVEVQDLMRAGEGKIMKRGKLVCIWSKKFAI